MELWLTERMALLQGTDNFQIFGTVTTSLSMAAFTGFLPYIFGVFASQIAPGELKDCFGLPPTAPPPHASPLHAQH